MADDVERFGFRFTTAYRIAALPFGVVPGAAVVEVGDGALRARYGPWVVDTPLANVAGTCTTGPYRRITTLGGARLSMSDKGLTFASNPDVGVCITFHHPVTGLDPLGVVRHPGLTVTVADPEGLVAALVPATDGDPGALRERLAERTVRDLRDLARQVGVAHSRARRKDDLVALLLDEAPADELTAALDRSGPG